MTTHKEVFFRAMRGVEAPPCERLFCANQELCKKQRLACDAFGSYINRGDGWATRMIPMTSSERIAYRTPTKEKYQNLRIA